MLENTNVLSIAKVDGNNLCFNRATYISQKDNELVFLPYMCMLFLNTEYSSISRTFLCLREKNKGILVADPKCLKGGSVSSIDWLILVKKCFFFYFKTNILSNNYN